MGIEPALAALSRVDLNILYRILANYSVPFPYKAKPGAGIDLNPGSTGLYRKAKVDTA